MRRDRHFVVDLLLVLAPLHYRLLTGRPIDRDHADRIVDPVPAGLVTTCARNSPDGPDARSE